MHSDNKFGSVWELLSSDFQEATSHHYIVGVECSQMVGIGVRREDKATFDNDGAKNWCGVNVNQEIEAIRNINHVAFNGGEFFSPGKWLGPEVYISEFKSLGCDTAQSSNSNVQFGIRVKAWPLTS